MADLAAADVTVTIRDKVRKIDKVGKVAKVTIAYGNGVLKYPPLGVPLPAEGANGAFRLRQIDDFLLQDALDGYVRKYDLTNHTIRIFQSAGFTPAGSAALTGTPAAMAAAIRKISYQNVKGADADVADSMTADQAAGPTNDDAIDTYAAVAAGAWTYSENTEIDIPRNVALCLQAPAGGAITMEEGELSALVTGTFRGQAQTDTIAHTFGAGDKLIALSKFRWKYGVKPFDHITSVVITGLTANQNNLLIGIGLGRLLGVPVEPKDNVAGDFVKIVKNAADLAAVAYNDTNKTLDLGALADNDDLDIEIEVAEIGESYTPAGTVAFTGTPVAAGVLVELGNVAVPATSLRALILGL